MNPYSHLVNGPCQFLEARAERANAEARKGVSASPAPSGAPIESFYGRSIHEPEALRSQSDKVMGVQAGWNGPCGFVPYPGQAICGKGFAEWIQAEEANALGQEVLTVIKAFEALHQQTTQRTSEGARELVRIFERME